MDECRLSLPREDLKLSLLRLSVKDCDKNEFGGAPGKDVDSGSGIRL